ncbi:hypothetical protein AvCA_39580 [Azotobacter vinelandii CA]|uniref:Uncharacterized protein n=2 Tax=Azotobacter vinelandii TaxID=354 RepID=C1DDY9_AZOVD|nr:hypothetical protein Avin_39580 [Azotobacter vinelandii DJ]AGK14494.1 hypothetical protein AvCA_39580 [Azotobacter vinelandii CA]AGK21689.1 hypothetical protein AvCA6_39580 [Azotobacter vinelandii CA6]
MTKGLGKAIGKVFEHARSFRARRAQGGLAAGRQLYNEEPGADTAGGLS